MIKNILAMIMMVFITYTAKSQMVVTDPNSMMQKALQWAEEKAKWTEDKIHDAEVIVQMKKTLKTAKETKEKIEQSYNLAEKTYDEARKYPGLVTAGVPGMIYSLETVLEMPLNPARYIPDVGDDSRKLKKLLDYNAADHVNNDARTVLRDILKETATKYREDGKTPYKELRVTKPALKLMNLWGALDNSTREQEVDQMALKIELAEQYEKIAKSMLDKILTPDEISMSESDRLDLLLKVQKMYLEAKQLRKQATDDMKDHIQKNIITPEKMEYCEKKAIRWQVNNAFCRTLQYKNKNLKFSLYNWERKK